MADNRGATRKRKSGSLAATAKSLKRTAKSGDKGAKGTPRTAATRESSIPADISHDVLHGRAKPAIYAAVTKRLRSTT
jgi:hypothetical protein